MLRSSAYLENSCCLRKTLQEAQQYLHRAFCQWSRDPGMSKDWREDGVRNYWFYHYFTVPHVAVFPLWPAKVQRLIFWKNWITSSLNWRLLGISEEGRGDAWLKAGWGKWSVKSIDVIGVQLPSCVVSLQPISAASGNVCSREIVGLNQGHGFASLGWVRKEIQFM